MTWGRESFTAPRGRRLARVALALVGSIFVAYADARASVIPDADGSPELRVVVTQRPGAVQLRILLPDDVPAGSVEVRVTGRDVLVVGRDLWGRQRRSHWIRLSRPVVEDGAQADYERDGSITVTLRVARGS